MLAHRSTAEAYCSGSMEDAVQIDFEDLGIRTTSGDSLSGKVSAVSIMGSGADSKNVTHMQGAELMKLKGGSALDHGDDEAHAQSRGNACRLRVERRAPFVIKHADENWLHMFGFCRGDVTGRALRVCQGPDTERKGMADLIGQADGVLDSVTLYSKAGDDKNVFIRAMPVNDSDGADECLLEMHDVDAPVESSKQENEYPRVILSAQAPHVVEQINIAFLSFFGYTMPQVTAQGIGIIFGVNTDKHKWKNFLQAGAAGHRQSIQLVTVSADHSEISVTVQVSSILNEEGETVSLAVSFEGDVTNVTKSNSQNAKTGGSPQLTVRRAVDGEGFSRSSSSGSNSTSNIENVDVIGNVKFHLDALKSMRQRLNA